MLQPRIFKLATLGSVALQRTGTGRAPKGLGPWMRQPQPVVLPPLVIAGVTRDSAGAPLGNCSIDLFRTSNDALACSVQSDGSGNYVSNPVGLGEKFYAVAYKPGSPDVAGTSVNTLTGS